MLFVAVMLSASLASRQTPASAPPSSTSGISGRVVAEGVRTPLPGARVTLIPTGRRQGPPGPPAQVSTDQDGRYVFSNVAPGAYRVQVEKAGYAPAVDIGQLHAVTVAAGQKLEGVDVELRPGGAIAGRILDPSGAPLAEARIMVLRRVRLGNGGVPRLLPAPGQGQQTNDLGEFRVYGLPAGEYFVAASPRPALSFGDAGVAPPAPSADGTTTLATTYYPGTLDPTQAQPITVTPGATANNMSFSLLSVPAYRITGVVVDAAGAPVSGAMVMLMGDPGSGNMFFGPGATARTQDDGAFVLANVAPGTYRVNASVMRITGAGIGAGSVSFSASAGNGPMAQPTAVTVADGDVTGLQVVVGR